MLTPERLAELRHVAEQAASMPAPFGPWWHRYHAELVPGVVLELLDLVGRMGDLADEFGARYEKHRTDHAAAPGPYDEGYLDALDLAEQLARRHP